MVVVNGVRADSILMTENMQTFGESIQNYNIIITKEELS
jgi:hypothetical protein